MKLFYLALAWLFIIGEYVLRAVAFVRHMNAKPVGRHAGGRHLAAVVDPALAYVPRRVDGAQSHKRRQGMLVMPTYREQDVAA